MRLRPQTAFCRPILKVLVQAVTARNTHPLNWRRELIP
jgi:hypothetical protein